MTEVTPMVEPESEARESVTPVVQPEPEPVASIAEANRTNTPIGTADIFSLLALNPDGLTNEELEHHFLALGLSRQQLRAHLKKLIDSGKVRKSDKVFLAI
jgi:DNA-binding transcriptional regulator GbsR (MarR family)